MKFLHTMIRVTDIEESIDFYCNKLGLVEIRRKEVPEGRSKLAYYMEAGFQKVLPTNRKITEASK